MRNLITTGVVVLFLLSVFSLFSCATQKVSATAETIPQPVATKEVEVAPPPQPVEEKPAGFTYHTLYFDFDRSEVLYRDREYLDRLAEFLLANDDTLLTIAGHADERGAIDYNFSLGEQRALVIKQELQKRGIAPERIRILSYGEERPAVSGETEDAYSRNRRAEFEEMH
ncbi:MAG TPA: OmpA family protein [bacterium]|nr:OmpA family protein [bacterium]